MLLISKAPKHLFSAASPQHHHHLFQSISLSLGCRMLTSIYVYLAKSRQRWFPVTRRSVLCMHIRIFGERKEGRKRRNAGKRVGISKYLECNIGQTIGRWKRKKKKEKTSTSQKGKTQASTIPKLLLHSQISSSPYHHQASRLLFASACIFLICV